MISFLKDVFISARFSGSNPEALLGPNIRFTDRVFSAIGASKPPETSSATAFFFLASSCHFSIRKVESSARGEFFEEVFCSTSKQRNSLSLLQLAKLTN